MAEKINEAVENTEEIKKDNPVVAFAKGIPGGIKKNAKGIAAGAVAAATAIAGGWLIHKRISEGDFEVPFEKPSEGTPEA